MKIQRPRSNVLYIGLEKSKAMAEKIKFSVTAFPMRSSLQSAVRAPNVNVSWSEHNSLEH